VLFQEGANSPISSLVAQLHAGMLFHLVILELHGKTNFHVLTINFDKPVKKIC